MTGTWVVRVKLTPEQREMIVSTLNGMKRSPKLRDPAVQAKIVQRIERALTKIETGSFGPVPANSFERLQEYSKAGNDADAMRLYAVLHEAERDLLDLLATKGGDKQAHAAQAAESLRLGRGEKYGKYAENKTRFLADQLADLFEIGLGLRAGHGDKSAFRRLLDVVCEQVGLPVLSRDAIEAITRKHL